MSALTFTLKYIPEASVDLSALTPDNLEGKNLKEIKALKITIQNRRYPITDYFSIKGRDSSNIHFEHADKSFQYVGKNMSFGQITVSGNLGDFTGYRMSGGTISVQGSVKDYAGAMMSGGELHISRNAGHFLGSATRTEKQGMSNGAIFVGGNAGDRVGNKMRRGLILIKKSCGNYCGSQMIAGTIIVMQRAGDYIGTSMRRGSIILMQKPGIIPPTIRSCGDLKMPFLTLLSRQLKEMGMPFRQFKNLQPEAHRYSGDLANDGKGEILICKSV